MEERRYLPGAEIRMTTDSGKPVFEIQGIVFDQWSQNLGGFKEIVRSSAWNGVDTSDIRAQFNHDANFVLGRVKAGTLQIDLRSDSVWGIVTPPDTQWARDLAVSVDRGDISGSSFAFRTAKGGDKWDLTKPVAERTVTSFSLVREFSIVTYPAYEQTSSSYAMRSALHAYAENPADGLPEELRHRIEKLGLVIPTVTEASEEQREETPIVNSVRSVGTYSRRLRALHLSAH